jgi:hypothetical protein
MTHAGVTGSHATPRGLRHAFGVGTLQCAVPLNLVQRWLGNHTNVLQPRCFRPPSHCPARAQIARLTLGKLRNPFARRRVPRTASDVLVGNHGTAASATGTCVGGQELQ